MDKNNYTLLEEATARLMQCFGVLEGTIFKSDWSDFGITPEMAMLLEEAWAKHYVNL